MTIKVKVKKIDISIQRRMYWSDEVESLHVCPECQSSLINENQTYLVILKQKKRHESFIMSSEEGYFCPECPVVVLDKDEFTDLVTTVFNYDSGNLLVRGIVNLDAIPEDKRNIPFGTDDNPIPLVVFSNYSDVSTSRDKEDTVTPIKSEKIRRNDPCPCGSGKKYKKCCLQASKEQKKES